MHSSTASLRCTTKPLKCFSHKKHQSWIICCPVWFPSTLLLLAKNKLHLPVSFTLQHYRIVIIEVEIIISFFQMYHIGCNAYVWQSGLKKHAAFTCFFMIWISNLHEIRTSKMAFAKYYNCKIQYNDPDGHNQACENEFTVSNKRALHIRVSEIIDVFQGRSPLFDIIVIMANQCTSFTWFLHASGMPMNVNK